jgi:hypothetical protein
MRVLVIGVAVIAMLATLSASKVLAAGSITAFTVNGNPGSWLMPNEVDFDPSNSTVHVGPYGDGITFTGQMTTPSHTWTIIIIPPTGSALSLGTYTTQWLSDGAHVGMDLIGDGRSCDGDTGSVTISELARDPDTNAIVAFAASYHFSCGGSEPAIAGELRWNSTVDYVGVSASPEAVQFGASGVNDDSAPVVVTVRSDGTVPVTVGSASLAGTSPGQYAITANTCSGVILSPGQTCTISVLTHPTATGAINARLQINTSTLGGLLTVPLAANGVVLDRGVTVAPPAVSFTSIQVGTSSPATNVVVTATPSSPVTLGTLALSGTGAASFAITADACSGATLSPGQQCTVSVKAKPTALGQQNANLVVPHNGVLGSATVPLVVFGVLGATGTYYPLSPFRILDTRTDGAPGAPLGAGKVLHLKVTGAGGVAASGVSAVVLNVTVTSPTAASYLAVYPTGAARPTVSNLNFKAGWTGANNVTVPVGTGGQVDIYNLAGTTHVIADVLGFYAADNSVETQIGFGGAYGIGGQYQPVLPERILDTRSPEFGAPLPGGDFVVIPVDYGLDLNSHIRALAVNVTSANAAGNGFLTTWNGQNDPPLASTVNFTAHSVVPNMAIVPVAGCTIAPSCAGLPAIAVYNGSKLSTDVIVDIFGFYDDGALGDGLTFHPITPVRITDTRSGLGAPTAIGPKATATITTPPTVANANTVALAANVTAVAPTASTFLSVWPADAGLSQPVVSTVNATAGQIVPNAALITIGPELRFSIFNNAGKTNVLVDVAGTFDFVPLPATAATITSATQRARLTSSLVSHRYYTQPQAVQR